MLTLLSFLAVCLGGGVQIDPPLFFLIVTFDLGLYHINLQKIGKFAKMLKSNAWQVAVGLNIDLAWCR